MLLAVAGLALSTLSTLVLILGLTLARSPTAADFVYDEWGNKNKWHLKELIVMKQRPKIAQANAGVAGTPTDGEMAVFHNELSKAGECQLVQLALLCSLPH